MSGLKGGWKKAATLVGVVCGLEVVALAAVAGVGLGAWGGARMLVIVCVVALAFVCLLYTSPSPRDS